MCYILLQTTSNIAPKPVQYWCNGAIFDAGRRKKTARRRFAWKADGYASFKNSAVLRPALRCSTKILPAMTSWSIRS